MYASLETADFDKQWLWENQQLGVKYVTITLANNCYHNHNI